MRKLAALILALSLTAAAMLLVWKSHELAHHPAPQLAPVVLEQALLQPRPVRLTVPVTADVQALREAVVSSRISAYVKELPLFEGQRFAAGELLVVLDQSQARADLLRAEATLAQTRLQRETLAADLAAADSNVKAAQAKLVRVQSLHEHQNASLEAKETAEAALASLRAGLSTAEAAVHSYDSLLEANAAQVEAAREALQYTAIAAPFAGVVSQRLAQSGDLVTPGKPLLKITDPAAGTRLLVSVPESLRPVALKVGDRVLRLEPWPEATPLGLRRFETRDTAGGALPGERISAQLVLVDEPAALLIPNTALLNDDGASGTVLAIVDKHRGEQQTGAAGEPAAVGVHHVAAHAAGTETQGARQHAGAALAEVGPAEDTPHGHQHTPRAQTTRAAGVEALRVVLAARGSEGAVTRDQRLIGRPLLLGSPDLLSRVQAGAAFRTRRGEE